MENPGRKDDMGSLGNERPAIWSVPPGMEVGYFVIFGLLVVAGGVWLVCVLVAKTPTVRAAVIPFWQTLAPLVIASAGTAIIRNSYLRRMETKKENLAMDSRSKNEDDRLVNQKRR